MAWFGSGEPISSLDDEITDKIIAELEPGRVMGLALGNGGAEGATRHAGERHDRDPSWLPRLHRRPR
ncbi:hypothetical protein [Bradyrhizobium genosp. P]|uniref:hypothetical protein n=1 Tax=Bradyrhizobium genosp. P TaxID=83641 RepID=UPI003CEA15D8